MRLTVHEEPGAIAALADEWRRLALADPAATVFHMPEFAEVWWAEFADLRKLRIAEARAGGTLAALAPMSLEPDGALRFLGDLDTTDYLGPLSRPEDRDEAAAVVVDAALATEGWSLCELHGLAADSGWPAALAAAAKAVGLEVEERRQEVCPRVPLPATYGGYLEFLSTKLRHEIRRKARRLERDAGAYAVRLSDGASLERDLALFFAMHRSSDGPKGKFMHEGMASFFTRFARTLLAGGRLRLAFLEVGGVAVAGAFCFADRGTWAVYNSAYDHARRELAPGMVLVGELIRLAVEGGCDTFDFLRGAEEYKYRFGAEDLPLVQLTLRRPG